MPVRAHRAPIAALLVLASALLAACPASAARPVVEKDVAYGTASPSQSLDAYYTPGTTGRPWVMVVHGGSWSFGDKSGMLTAVGTFKAAGFVVFNTNYRLSTEAPWSAQRLDVANALLFVKKRWRTYGINPSCGGL